MGDEGLVQERVDALLASHPPASTERAAFLGAQFDHGLAWVHFPVGYGGLGVDRKHQHVVTSALRAADAPFPPASSDIGLGMAAPVVVTHGSEEQKLRYLRPIFTVEETWCQLFSEPGAGSDVAGLSTLAVRDGDEWVVNGQKIWTSVAHMSRWGLLAARTDPSAPKHKGMTYFVLDMEARGVDVRPLRQMTGEAEFNEVFLTDVRIPDAERLGDPGDGWRVMLTTLMNERVAIGNVAFPRGSGVIGDALRLWSKSPRPALRDRMVSAWIDAEVFRLTVLRAAGAQGRKTPGPEGSINKLARAQLNQKVYELCVDLLGMESTLYGGYELERPPLASNHDDIPRAFLRSRANTIEGGTSEIMKNIIAERVLGLPGDVRIDRDRPWRDVPRSA